MQRQIKRHQQKTLEIKRGTTIIKVMIKSCAKDISGLDTKKIMLTSFFSRKPSPTCQITKSTSEVNSSVEIGTSSRANSCRASAVPIFCILQSCHLSRASPGLCWQVTSLDSFLPPILGTARGPFQLVPSRATARKQSAKNVK